MPSTACPTPAGPPRASPPPRAKCEGGPLPSVLYLNLHYLIHTCIYHRYKHTKRNRYKHSNSCIHRVMVHMNLVRRNKATINTTPISQLRLRPTCVHTHTRAVQSSNTTFSATAFRQNHKLMSMLE